MRNDLLAAVRFFAHADLTQERADAVRAYLAEEPGRDVEVTRQLPESLPPDTWVWFTERAHTGAGYLHPDGAWRIFAAGATLRSDGRWLLADESRTFVVGRPAVVAADDDATRPAPLERDAEPLVPDSEPLPPDSGSESARVAPQSPAAGERPRPAHPPLFLEEPWPGLGDDGRAVPEIAERRPPLLNWKKSSSSLGSEFCVEVAAVWR
jgi:hypothetical protein